MSIIFAETFCLISDDIKISILPTFIESFMWIWYIVLCYQGVLNTKMAVLGFISKIEINKDAYINLIVNALKRNVPI